MPHRFLAFLGFLAWGALIGLGVAVFVLFVAVEYLSNTQPAADFRPLAGLVFPSCGLIGVLVAGLLFVPYQARNNIARFRADGDVVSLRRVLRSARNQNVRLEAVLALTSLGDHGAVPDLVLAMTRDTSRIRKAAANALHELRWIPASDKEAGLYALVVGDWAQAMATGLAPRLCIKHGYGSREMAPGLMVHIKRDVSPEIEVAIKRAVPASAIVTEEAADNIVSALVTGTEVGDYGLGGSGRTRGIRIEVEIIISDRERNRTVAQGHFSGAPPPPVIRADNRSYAYGLPSSKEIADFIAVQYAGIMTDLKRQKLDR